MLTALGGDEWPASRPSRSLHPGKTRYPLYRSLDGCQGRSGRAKNLAPPGFDPRTVQPVVSRYTDWATRPMDYEARDHLFYVMIYGFYRIWKWRIPKRNSEIHPTRCNNCVYSSQWLYSTCFGWQFHPSSGVHMLYMASGRQVYLCCNFFLSIMVVLSL